MAVARTPGMRTAAVIGAASIPMAMLDVVPGGGSVAFIVLAALVGWRLLPGFWRIVGTGAIGGAAAGLLILGPGARLAMRVVAIVDPFRTPELTLEGTAFLVLIFGGVFGGTMGVVGNLLREGLPLRARTSAAVMTVIVMATFLADPGLRSEFTDLGAGAWMNIPMFAAVVFAYSRAGLRLVERTQARVGRSTSPVGADVRA